MSARKQLELSIVILGYGSQESLRKVVHSLLRATSELAQSFEIILVANYWEGKLDRTPEIAKELATEHDHIRVVCHPKEGAMGWDMRSGLDQAQGKYIIVTDGDDQNPIEDVVRMYHTMVSSQADIMKGRRTKRFDGLYRYITSFGFNILFLLLFRTRGLWDINGKPKGFTHEAYQQLNLQSNDWFIDAEIILKARKCGFIIRELPVIFYSNEERASFVKFSAIFEFLQNMFKTKLHRRK